MKETPEFLQRVRKRLLRGFGDATLPRGNSGLNRSPVCLEQIASWANRVDLCGFEDPRVAALSQLSQGVNECGRSGCSGSYKVKGDTVTELSPCSGVDACLSEVWDELNRDDTQSPSRVDKLSRFPSVASSEQIGYLCMRLGCDFNCGYTFTSRGQHGTCTQQSKE